MSVKKNSYRKKKAAKPQPTSAAPSSDYKTRIRFDLSILSDRRFTMSLGLFFLFFSVFLGLALISFIFTGKADQSVVESAHFGQLIVSGKEAKNWLGITGALFAHLFAYHGFGIAALLFIPPVFALGVKMVFGKTLFSLKRGFQLAFFFAVWCSLLLGYIAEISNTSDALLFYSGGIGYRIAQVFDSLVGWGTLFFLTFSLGVFLIYYFRKGTFGKIQQSVKNSVDSLGEVKREVSDRMKGQTDQQADEQDGEETSVPSKTEPTPNTTGKRITQLLPAKAKEAESDNSLAVTKGKPVILVPEVENPTEIKPGEEPTFSIEDTTLQTAEVVSVRKNPPRMENSGQLIIEDGNHYDPHLDLPHYQMPPLDLLNEQSSTKVKVTTEELQSNKDKIVETLNNFKISITSIKATIGPTVTLYEIVPEAGIKISRIKNLEDDIALSLAALGIRIIAPIPGKGTIGIEVPNKNREMVSMKTVLATEQFMHAEKELPIALGKTISNEVFVTDLTKMPHLLIAGATGQGKSVGLNVVLTSLLYKKHPSELKFVLVDPKKVELSLFTKIERHFLATLPDTDDAILTDTSKVVDVLNSLCVEMEMRYNLLKNAGCRHLKEYNRKFINRRLNPEKGHRFLPYIVLVIDELADLMMTAGKEVEMPIARLAQLARAIGIHLIIATQRPSVDVITGLIKANFPARLSFKVSSRIDSRTILDTGGAEQLVGQGDMLLSNSSDIIRLQCAFVDTDEIERLCEFVGNQKGYDTAYSLPEVESDVNEPGKVDLSQRDPLFDDAARVIVLHQQGSTSLVQRKLSLGYNRAGRIIDQLEAAGIVGPFEGSKARQVLVDEFGLEKILSSLQ